MNDWLAWYVAARGRVGRGVFNWVLVAASVPGLLFGVYGMADSAGGLLAPLLGLLDAGQSLQQGVGNGGLDPYALGDAMRQMQSAGEGFAAAGEVGGPSFAWAELVDMLIWLALVPLMLMRLRDAGVREARLWWWLVFMYAGMLMADVEAMADANLFGWWDWPLGFVGMLVLGWLTIAHSRERKQGGVTGDAASAKVRLDDTDPYPPFRP
ncbi:MAG: hypothetical protein H6922_04900 [Pseudomonadaceae bacterium]|nr:hypothetical protein [Pseudomonadaceae bacterium]